MVGTLSHWKEYWELKRKRNQPSSREEAYHPILDTVWSETLSSIGDFGNALDLCCGDGSLVRRLVTGTTSNKNSFFAIDGSVDALNIAKTGLPSVRFLAADASFLPFSNNTFNLIVSQFGIEYAGKEAIDEIARIALPDAHFVAVMHYKGSSIFSDSTKSLSATKSLEKSNFFPLCKNMFTSAYEALSKKSLGPYRENHLAFLPAFKNLEKIMDKHGSDAADGMILSLYNTTAEIQNNLKSYQQQDVLHWVNSLEESIAHYTGRLRSMKKAALNENEIKEWSQQLENNKFLIKKISPITLTEQQPLAILLQAQKKAA